jgi:hypothetical protein
MIYNRDRWAFPNDVGMVYTEYGISQVEACDMSHPHFSLLSVFER